MCRRSKLIIAVIVAFLLAVGSWLLIRHNARVAPSTVALEFCRRVESGDASRIREMTKIPAFLSEKTPQEQEHLLLELLSSEISSEGTRKLTSDGQFGSLSDIFPDDADSWAKSFGVSPNDCVAFRMEREGIRAELVLFKSNGQYLILRCNNVRQMAGEISQS